jgi:phenylalanyl-tRNA synthetase beta chain
MLVPLSWLKDYVDISDISVEELQRRMSAAGLSVERKQIVGQGIESIVIGQIVAQDRHPDSDHLWVCRVQIGSEEVQIVTGAQNIYLHGKVPVIRAGYVLPDGTKIEVSKLRGVESQGMMCSEKELQLGEGHEGIMMLGDDAVVGQRVADYLGLPDVVFDTEITANRGDCLSMVGIAREVATLFGRELKMPVSKPIHKVEQHKYSVRVQIEDTDKCSRFAAVVFDGFQLKASPVWMQQRLLRAGMRPINNLVDISNYVMLEMGQPTHAYDTSQVKDQSFVVRTAQFDERLQTLDKKVFTLSSDMLVIADSEKSLGIAGVMGGQSSKIAEDTHSLLLELANFDPVNIRKTGMKLGIRTDAIVRYERGVDSQLIPIALERINFLLSELSGAFQSSDVIDAYPVPRDLSTVQLRSRTLSTYMGMEMELISVEQILNSLGFITLSKNGDGHEWLLTVKVPSWRQGDVSIEEDLIEEVARIFGYDNLPATIPSGQIPYVTNNKRLWVKRKTLELMKGLGYQEVLTYSFNSRDQLEQSGYSADEALEMVAPLTEEHRYMRLSLLPNLLWVTQKNLVLGRDMSLFELSSVYTRRLYELIPDSAVSLGLEPLHFAGVIYKKDYSFEDQFGQIRSTLAAICSQLQIKQLKVTQDVEKVRAMRNHSMFHPGRVAALVLGESAIGLFGEIHPSLVESNSLRQAVFIFELYFDAIVEEARAVVSYQPYSIFPATTESISFVIDEQQAVGPIVDLMRSLDPRIVSIHVGKPYRGDQIESGKKAVTFTFVFQSKDGVIKDTESSQLRNLITSSLESKFQIRVRE